METRQMNARESILRRFAVIQQIKDGIDEARRNGAEVEYPKFVDIDGVRVLWPDDNTLMGFPVKTLPDKDLG